MRYWKYEQLMKITGYTTRYSRFSEVRGNSEIGSLEIWGGL